MQLAEDDSIKKVFYEWATEYIKKEIEELRNFLTFEAPRSVRVKIGCPDDGNGGMLL